MDAETDIPPGKKILVVDDDQIILKTLTIALSLQRLPGAHRHGRSRSRQHGQPGKAGFDPA